MMKEIIRLFALMFIFVVSSFIVYGDVSVIDISDYGLDTDSNGLYDYLVIQVDVNTTTEGNYTVQADLQMLNSSQSYSIDEIEYLDEGENSIKLLFDGYKINYNQESGSFNVSSLIINGTQYLDNESYVTEKYNYTEFENTILNVTIDSVRFNGIELNGTVDVVPGSYPLDISFISYARTFDVSMVVIGDSDVHTFVFEELDANESYNISTNIDIPNTNGPYTFSIGFDDNRAEIISNYSLNVTVSEPVDLTHNYDNLSITKIDFSPNSPKPGEELKVTVELENTADEDIEDISITATFDDLEDDLGDEISDDTEAELRKGKDDKYEFKFTMPYSVINNFDYTLVVGIEGTGADSGISYIDVEEKQFKFNKKSHELKLSTFDVSPDVIRCSDSITIDYAIYNTGRNDEDVEIKAFSSGLGIDYAKEININEEEDYSDSLDFPVDAPVGSYVLDFEVNYGSKSIKESHSIDVEQCITAAPIPVIEENTEESSSDVYVVPFTDSGQLEETKQKTSFFETEDYFYLLVILVVLLVGVVIFALGAVIIVLRR